MRFNSAFEMVYYNFIDQKTNLVAKINSMKCKYFNC